MQWVRRILVHLCSVLLATPIGWCCWLPVVHAADEKAEVAKCCCCVPKEKPVKPQGAPEPSRSCCCDPLLVASSTSELTGKEATPALPAVLVPSASITAISLAIALNPPSLHDPSPPLHLLHCLWLC
jgi:hypothetical protein